MGQVFAALTYFKGDKTNDELIHLITDVTFAAKRI